MTRASAGAQPRQTVAGAGWTTASSSRGRRDAAGLNGAPQCGCAVGSAGRFQTARTGVQQAFGRARSLRLPLGQRPAFAAVTGGIKISRLLSKSGRAKLVGLHRTGWVPRLANSPVMSYVLQVRCWRWFRSAKQLFQAGQFVTGDNRRVGVANSSSLSRLALKRTRTRPRRNRIKLRKISRRDVLQDVVFSTRTNLMRLLPGLRPASQGHLARLSKLKQVSPDFQRILRIRLMNVDPLESRIGTEWDCGSPAETSLSTNFT